MPSIRRLLLSGICKWVWYLSGLLLAGGVASFLVKRVCDYACSWVSRQLSLTTSPGSTRTTLLIPQTLLRLSYRWRATLLLKSWTCLHPSPLSLGRRTLTNCRSDSRNTIQAHSTDFVFKLFSVVDWTEVNYGRYILVSAPYSQAILSDVSLWCNG